MRARLLSESLACETRLGLVVPLEPDPQPRSQGFVGLWFVFIPEVEEGNKDGEGLGTLVT